MSLTISIVTISYNQVEYLDDCLKSILTQEVPVEHIVMDGGSTDGSANLIQQYEDRIRYWVSQKDGGAPNALNVGFSKASGDFIGYINSDDFLLPGAMSALQKIIENNPGYDVYYGPGYIKNEITGETDFIIPTPWHLGVYRAGYSVMMQQSIFIRREKLLTSGIKFNTENKTQWDGEHLVDLDLAGARFFRHNIPLGVFRIHNLSMGGGVLGAEGASRFQEQVKVVNQKIDNSGKLSTRNRLYWFMWLFFNDPVNSIKRSLKSVIR